MPKTKSSRRTKNLDSYAQKATNRPQKEKQQLSLSEEEELPTGHPEPKLSNTELSIDVDASDKDLVILPEDNAPLMPKADLLRWLNVEESTVHTNFWKKKRADTPQEIEEETDVINIANSDSDSEIENIPGPSTLRALNIPFTLRVLDIPPTTLAFNTSQSSSRNSSTFPSRASSVALSVPTSDVSFNSQDSMDINKPEDTPVEDPLMAGLDYNGNEIVDAPINLMTPEELAEKGLEAFGVDLIDELGLNQLEMDAEREEDPVPKPVLSQPRISELPPCVDAAKQSDPKEWFVYADESLNLQAVEVGTNKPSPLSVPSAEEVDAGIVNLTNILKPRQKTGRGYKSPPSLGQVVLAWLGLMLQLLQVFKRAGLRGWIEQSLEITKKCSLKGPALAQNLRKWCVAFCKHKEKLPLSK
ncbi:hypothetical protein CPB85DRAFT_1445128 [Mucidula mucida]|nr:hypothetical protein CPB85DRAFT_1445128 [Mucidula mucida]